MRKAPNQESQTLRAKRMRFPDDKDKGKENINGAVCERKQGNDEGRHCDNMLYRIEFASLM